MKLETRIFSCFVLIAVFIFLSGCGTINWEVFPKQKTPFTAGATSNGIVVIKRSF